jgi:hypothetical protein
MAATIHTEIQPRRLMARHDYSYANSRIATIVDLVVWMPGATVDAGERSDDAGPNSDALLSSGVRLGRQGFLSLQPITMASCNVRDSHSRWLYSTHRRWQLFILLRSHRLMKSSSSRISAATAAIIARIAQNGRACSHTHMPGTCRFISRINLLSNFP